MTVVFTNIPSHLFIYAAEAVSKSSFRLSMKYSVLSKGQLSILKLLFLKNLYRKT